MQPLNTFLQFTLFVAAWLLLFVLILAGAGLIWRRHKAGRIALLLAGLLLLLVSVAYANGDVSWRLLPTLVTGYHYEPNAETPDPRLVPRRPELIIERQLAALVGQTGAAPLRPDTALAAYEIEAVHIDDWHKYHWLTAVIDATLTFADGSQEQVPLTLPAKGGGYILVPFFGEVNRYAFAWYAPESSLGHLLQTTAPATPLSDGSPPLILEEINTIDVAARQLEHVDPQTSFASVSDISVVGGMLLDVDLRQDKTSVGSAILLHTTGKTETLGETQISARAVFAPDGQRLAYADLDNRLWVKDLSSGEQQAIGWDVRQIGWGSGLAWRDDGQQLLFTSRNNTTLPDQQALWLWDAASGETRLLMQVGPGFLDSSEQTAVHLGQPCWADEETVLFAATLRHHLDDVHLLAARTDGRDMWDVTPDDAPLYPDLHCANGYVAANSGRTAVTLYEIMKR